MYYQEDLVSDPVKYKSTGKLYAFCNSLICFKKKNKNGSYSALGRELNVSRDEISCPTCSSAIYWTRESEIYKRRLVKNEP